MNFEKHKIESTLGPVLQVRQWPLRWRLQALVIHLIWDHIAEKEKILRMRLEENVLLQATCQPYGFLVF